MAGREIEFKIDIERQVSVTKTKYKIEKNCLNKLSKLMKIFRKFWKSLSNYILRSIVTNLKYASDN